MKLNQLSSTSSVKNVQNCKRNLTTFSTYKLRENNNNMADVRYALYNDICRNIIILMHYFWTKRRAFKEKSWGIRYCSFLQKKIYAPNITPSVFYADDLFTKNRWLLSIYLSYLKENLKYFKDLLQLQEIVCKILHFVFPTKWLMSLFKC